MNKSVPNLAGFICPNEMPV